MGILVAKYWGIPPEHSEIHQDLLFDLSIGDSKSFNHPTWGFSRFNHQHVFLGMLVERSKLGDFVRNLGFFIRFYGY